MQINIEIRHVGHAVGTIGWLAENAAQILISKTKDNGRQGAWLKDKEGKTITVLAIRGTECYPDGIEKASRSTEGWGPEITSHVGFTDAAWSVIEQLQEFAVAAMNETELTELASGYQVSVVR